MVNAVKTCLRKYATFKGTASRPEYWWFVLFTWLGDIVLQIVRLTPLTLIWFLALVVPLLAAAVRRNHDAGRSGWWILTGLVPLWGLILLCYPTKIEGNKYVDPQAPRPSALIESDVPASTMSCPKCGKLRLPGQNYCMGCGEPLTDTER